MAFGKRVSISPKGPGVPKAVPQPGLASSVGHKPSALPNVGAAPKPTASRRDYGKTAPPAGSAPQPSPFGPSVGDI